MRPVMTSTDGRCVARMRWMPDARAFCGRHSIGGEDAELVVFLVEHHLTMSSVAQKQDLSEALSS